MRLLDYLWFRYSLLFVFFCVAMALAPQPAPIIGALMWVLAAVAVRQKPNDRPSIMERSLQSIAAFSAAMIFYRFIRSGLALQGLVAEMGVAPGEVDAVAEAWARNIALVMLNASFAIPVGYAVYWGRMMFWDRLSVFFRPTATIEDINAVMKRGGRR
jgi:hypothetical protein